MKKAIAVSVAALTLTLGLCSASFSLPAVVIQTPPLALEVDSTADLNAVYLDSDSVVVDTSLVWEVIPDSLGAIDSILVFEALKPGVGIITASLGDLSDTVAVTITQPDSEDYFEQPSIIVSPGDTILTVGDRIKFTAWKCDTLHGCTEAAATWSLEGAPIGTFTEGDTLEVTTTGYALVVANTEFGSGSSLVVAESSDTTGDNTIHITRDAKGKKKVKDVKTLQEGEAWTISGLPHPLNVLNGGRLYFPKGCLHEDIRLHISIPGFIKDESDSVRGSHGIVNGLDLQVFVNDTLSEPYVFDSPLFVGLVFKRGLLNKLGIDPTTLSLAFAEVEGDTIIFDLSGISNTMVDSSRNRVFSNVAHFSTLVIRGEKSPMTSARIPRTLPKTFSLGPAYPNPFNPTTSVTVTLPRAAGLRVKVVDILGRQVAVLHEGRIAPGAHRLIFDGNGDASGIYFIVARTSGGEVQVRKVVLLK